MDQTKVAVRKFRSLSFWFALLGVLSISASALSSDFKSVRVACVGDSITQGHGVDSGRSYPSQLQEMLGSTWLVKNFGLGGRTLLRKGDLPYWRESAFGEACDFQPDVVVIMLGTNDLKPNNWIHRAEFVSDYQDLVETFQELKSHPRIFLCTPPPIPDPGNYGITEAELQEQLPFI